MSAVATIESPALDLAQAQRLTERARLVVSNLMEARAKLAQIMTEAQEGRVWEALDMPNIQAWAAFTFSETPLAQLSIDDRRVLVKELAEEGYGVRAIAPIVGTTKSSVDRDLKASVPQRDTPREVHGTDGITRTFQPKPEPVAVDHETGEIPDDDAHSPESDENWHTDYANGVRNDMEARTRHVIEYLDALAKHLPDDNVHPGAVDHIQGALFDQQHRINAAFKAAFKITLAEIRNPNA